MLNTSILLMMISLRSWLGPALSTNQYKIDLSNYPCIIKSFTENGNWAGVVGGVKQ